MRLDASSAPGPRVDATRLLGWHVPNVRHSYNERDTALYALSVGVGQDPLDRRQLALVDPWNAQLAALPTMALVLGYPGFWLGEPAVRAASGIEPSMILHAEQSVELHAPLPVRAEVMGRTRVTGLLDKGAKRGCLLYSERTIDLLPGGLPLATCRQVHFLKGCGGFGDTGFTAPSPHAMPLGSPVVTVTSLIRPEQALMYRLNGDANALHFDPRAASKAGLDRPLFHGMGTMGVVAHALIAGLLDYDTSRLRSISLRMTAPVFPGDTLRTEVWADGSFRARALERDSMVIDHGHALIN